MLGHCLTDIYIKGKVDPKGILASSDALEETERLERIFDQRIENNQLKYEGFWKICSLNVRSLNKHKEDVAKDNFILSADIFGIEETWLHQGQTEKFDDYEGHFANF